MLHPDNDRYFPKKDLKGATTFWLQIYMGRLFMPMVKSKEFVYDANDDTYADENSYMVASTVEVHADYAPLEEDGEVGLPSSEVIISTLYSKGYCSTVLVVLGAVFDSKIFLPVQVS